MYHSIRFVFARAQIKKDNKIFHVGTAHLPVTERGSVTEYQREALQGFLSVLENEKEIVFVGDFNAPRGGEIFSAIAAKYTDNVPQEYLSSLDPKLHRAGPIDRMVDGIFSTPHYSVSDVRMESGVSDHCALVATVTKI
jgi:endonuclease/exonuclease/phosphatase family metal-dependent hydrolase